MKKKRNNQRKNTYTLDLYKYKYRDLASWDK